MENNKEHTTFPSELRYDIVSGDWVVIATGRAKRPSDFQRNGFPAREVSKADCPFENFEFGKRFALSVPNKYPAFSPIKSPQTKLVGPYQVMDGVGFHEVLVTKDHIKDIPQFSHLQVKELVDLYQERYLSLMKEEFVNYIAIFKNKGPQAGATVAHPHSQLIATPVVNPDMRHSLEGSAKYFATNQKCVHCVMLEWEIGEKHRVIFSNDHFIALCPFASTVAFEIRIYPRTHAPHFEQASEEEKSAFADALLSALKKLFKGLKDPDYNYFLHTAPIDGEDYSHYHWHLEILPKTSTFAGFELGTGIFISTIEPEKAAQFLKSQ